MKKFGFDKFFDIFKLIPHNIDFTKKEYENLMFLFQKSKLENSMFAVMDDVVSMLGKMSSNPTIYNELRNIFRTYIPLDHNIHNTPSVIDLLDNTLPKTMLNKSFSDLYEEGRKIETSKNEAYSKIISTFMQLDFVGYGSDKINTKNQYSNLFNDALHCFYGAHCDVFLTADKKTIKKTKAVYEHLDITTKVYNPNELLEKLS